MREFNYNKLSTFALGDLVANFLMCLISHLSAYAWEEAAYPIFYDFHYISRIPVLLS